MKNLIITMKETNYRKEGKKWIETESTTKNINEKYYNNILESKSFFTNLGGSERHYKNYTCKGYIVTRVNSINPDRTEKTVRTFQFDYK